MNQMNVMNFNPMNMMGNIQQQEKGLPITLTIKSEFNPNINTVKCFPDDKASVIREKCNITGINENDFYLTHRYHLIRENLSIIDNDIREDSPIYLTTYLYQLRFKTGYGSIFTVRLEGNCPIGVAIIIFFVKFFPELMIDALDDKGKNFRFSYNRWLFIHDKTPLKQIFGSVLFPEILISGI